MSRTASTGRFSMRLSRNTSERRSKTPCRSGPVNSLLRSLSRKNMDSNSLHTASVSASPSLSRNESRRNSTIMYSNSNGLIKPPDMVKRLECTLEDLCFGFEGMGNETPGTCPADVTFVIDEKQHPVFKRLGDNLELSVEVSLVQALTGCTLNVPFLGGQQSCLVVDDVVTPGYKKIVAGQGMALPKEQGKRGDLIVKFSVQFPPQLTQEQRSDVFNILQDSC